MPQISNPKNDRRSLTHAGHEVGDDKVTLRQNQVDVNSPVLMWECPRKFQTISYSGGSHKTKFVPRNKESVENAPDAEDGYVVIDLESSIQPIHGEPDPRDQAYPPVVAKNVTQDAKIVPEEYHYATNEVVFAEADVDVDDELALFPILVEGTLQYRGLDQFDHEIAPLDQWSEPIHVFHDFDQDKNETEVHLIGAAEWSESEKLALYIDSPHQIVWEDPDYPDGQYVSRMEQRVDVSV